MTILLMVSQKSEDFYSREARIGRIACDNPDAHR